MNYKAQILPINFINKKHLDDTAKVMNQIAEELKM